MICTEYKPINKGALLGFCNLEMTSGLILKDCQHCNSNGREWVSPPSRPMLDTEGRQMYDEKGKKMYANMIDFKSKDIRDKWSTQALAAINLKTSYQR